MEVRKPNKEELYLLKYLVKKANINLSKDWETKIMVENMLDGGMGSLYLYPDGEKTKGNLFGSRVSDFEFIDKDGIIVSIELYLDKNDNLYELDIWKIDSSPLIELPNIESY